MANKYEKKYAPALKRAQDWAAKLGIKAPSKAVEANGAPSQEMLNFCQVTNLTLDHIYLGEPQTREVFDSGRILFMQMAMEMDQNELEMLAKCMSRMIGGNGQDEGEKPLDDFKVWHADYLAKKQAAA